MLAHLSDRLFAYCGHDDERQTGLTDPPWPGEGDQAHRRVLKQISDGGAVTITSEQRSWRSRDG